ncbi:MAG TPA: lamin tail domain-containing protein [Polyangium sp.]|nr:lamin tail domain-containing protein [Polyangium sp.]
MQRLRGFFGGLLLLTLANLAVFGCAESTTTRPPGGETSSGSSSGGSSSSSTSSSSGQSSSGGTANLVVNELQTTTEDWVEIVNVGDGVADLSAMGLADQDTDGTPKLAEAVRFIEGEKLVPGEYLVVVANVKNPNAGPQGDCLQSGGPATCYQAAWGISGTNGDKIFLLSPTDEIIDSVVYPANAVLDGQSYCRLPNGAGDFQACTPTPGELNAGP